MQVMNHVIQEWRLKNLDTVDENTVKTRITRLLDDADKLGKFTRDMKKPEFIAKYQAKYDVVFNIAKSPVKVPTAHVKPDPSNHATENDSMVQSMFLVSPLK